MKIIIDGGFFFMKSLFSMLKNKKDFSKEDLIKKYDNDMASLLGLSYDKNIFFCVDYGSWRKKECSEYKAKRKDKQRLVLDWDLIRTSQNLYVEYLKESNCVTIFEKDAEADDIIYVLAKEFSLKGISSLIISADRDLNQLLKFEDNSFFIAQLDSVRNRVFVNSSYVEPLNAFESSMDANNSLFSLISMNDLDVVKVEPFKFLFNKVLGGDLGDDLDAIYSKKVLVKKPKKDGQERTKRISGQKLEKIVENNIKDFQTFEDFENLEKLENITKRVCQLMEDENETERSLTLLQRNIKLMILHEKWIPFEIEDKIKKQIKYDEIDVISFFNRELKNINLIKTSEIFNSEDWEAFL